jgi:hypothetical protein
MEKLEKKLEDIETKEKNDLIRQMGTAIVLKADLVIPNYRGYGEIKIPAGVRLSHMTACGFDPNYNFVDELDWIDEFYPDIARILKHDFCFYSYNVPAEMVITLEDYQNMKKGEQ